MSSPIVERHGQEMPASAHLSESEFAVILSYIRTSFGFQTSGAIEGEVAAPHSALE